MFPTRFPKIPLPRCTTSLVDAYTKVLQPVAAQRTYVEAGRDRKKTLERCVHRWEFDREKQAKKEATLAAADADRVAFRSIDWHDFVVVEVLFVFVGLGTVGWGEVGLMQSLLFPERTSLTRFMPRTIFKYNKYGCYYPIVVFTKHLVVGISSPVGVFEPTSCRGFH